LYGDRNKCCPPIVRDEPVLVRILEDLIVAVNVGLDETKESQLPGSGDKDHRRIKSEMARRSD
jgi:hypothetical protein